MMAQLFVQESGNSVLTVIKKVASCRCGLQFRLILRNVA